MAEAGRETYTTRVLRVQTMVWSADRNSNVCLSASRTDGLQGGLQQRVFCWVQGKLKINRLLFEPCRSFEYIRHENFSPKISDRPAVT